MDDMPPDEWVRLSAELSGRAVRVEARYPGADAELIAADLPFDGLRLDGPRLVALAAGGVVYTAELPVRLVLCGDEALLVEAPGAPALLLTFRPTRHPRQRPPARERVVGGG